ncbi:MAG: NDP-sugar synthase [Thermoplasmata archaeon]|nr:NDP-sugar synthase [Thermoplasmata archaeon]MCI4356574.1 NDP-sugar synthase [Thermoplasmata archaeon]
MQALVLIGGFGTRLRPVTYDLPKQLIPIAGKPMLYHALDLLPREVDRAVFATGYKADVIAEYVRAHPHPRLAIRTVPEAEPLGTGGGMRNAGDGIGDPFVLLNSDVISDVNVTALLAFHRERQAYGTMYLHEVEDVRPYGVAALDARDRIERFVEKPEPADAPSRWINAGVHVWAESVLEQIPRGRPVSFEREIVPGILDRGVYGFRSHGYWEDAGTPERLLHAQRLLFDGGRGGASPLPSGASGTGPVAVGRGVSADGGSFGPYVTLSDGVSVRAGAHVENSVLLEGAVVGAGATVRNSIIGPNFEIPPGRHVLDAVLANARPP